MSKSQSSKSDRADRLHVFTVIDLYSTLVSSFFWMIKGADGKDHIDPFVLSLFSALDSSLTLMPLLPQSIDEMVKCVHQRQARRRLRTLSHRTSQPSPSREPLTSLVALPLPT